MNAFRHLMVFLAFLTAAVASGPAAQESLVDQILDQAPDAIVKIEGNQIFFNPEKVHLYDGRIWVETLPAGAIALPVLFSSDSGLYMTVGSKRDREPTWICTSCTATHDTEPRWCRVCGKMNFIVRYLAPKDSR